MWPDNCIIFDFETLSKNPQNGVALSFAILAFNEETFISNNPYTWKDLLNASKVIKFDVTDQVKNYGRKIMEDTVEWWSKLPVELQRAHFIPNKKEDKPISEIPKFIKRAIPQVRKIKYSYTRGNMFDPVLLESLCNDLKIESIVPWWTIRDTRSKIDGMSYGANIHNKFVPDELKSIFVEHDPIHDICMDVIRMQTLARLIS